MGRLKENNNLLSIHSGRGRCKKLRFSIKNYFIKPPVVVGLPGFDRRYKELVRKEFNVIKV